MKFPSIFSSAKHKSGTVAVCDIGSGSVAVGIVEIHPGSAARIVASERRALKLEERSAAQSVDQIKTLTQETASAVLDVHIKQGGHPPEEVIAILHVPWVRSETVSKSKKFDEPVTITATHIRELAQEAAQEKTALKTENIFERSVLWIALNGYPTKKPEGKQAARIGLTVLQSEIRDGLLRTLTDVLGSVFVGRIVAFHSISFVLQVVIREYLPMMENYTLIDVTSMATSTSVIRKGSLASHQDAPIGWRTIVSELASIHGTTQTEALSRMRLMSEDVCTDAVCQSVGQALSKMEPKFVDAYGTMFNELTKQKKIPGTVILVAPPDIGGWFAGVLSRIDFAQFSMSEKPFSIQFLHEEYFTGKVEIAEKLSEDVGIAVGAGFMHIRARGEK